MISQVVNEEAEEPDYLNHFVLRENIKSKCIWIVGSNLSLHRKSTYGHYIRSKLNQKLGLYTVMNVYKRLDHNFGIEVHLAHLWVCLQ